MKGPIKIKWPQRFRQKPLLFLLLFSFIVFLSILASIAPEISSSELENWFRKNLGEDYQRILIIGLIIGTALFFYLAVYLSGGKKRKIGLFTIPWSLDNETHAKVDQRAVLKACSVK